MVSTNSISQAANGVIRDAIESKNVQTSLKEYPRLPLKVKTEIKAVMGLKKQEQKIILQRA